MGWSSVPTVEGLTGAGGCLRYQEGGPAGGKGMAISVPQETGEGEGTRGTQGEGHGRPGVGRGRGGGQHVGREKGSSGCHGDGGVGDGGLCFLLSFLFFLCSGREEVCLSFSCKADHGEKEILGALPR